MSPGAGELGAWESDDVDDVSPTEALAAAREALRQAQRALTLAEEAAGLTPAGSPDHAEENDRVALRVDELTVKRINVVEDDGRLRLLIAGSSQSDSIPMRGVERTHPGRGSTAGLLFVNDDGTECGGLQFSGAPAQGDDKKAVQTGYMTFDDFEQNEGIRIGLSQTGSSRERFVELLDRPDWSIVDLADDVEEATDDDTRAAARARYYTDVADLGASRVLLAREQDGSARLVLRDGRGQDRLRFIVPLDGEPIAEAIDTTGTSHTLIHPTTR